MLNAQTQADQLRSFSSAAADYTHNTGQNEYGHQQQAPHIKVVNIQAQTINRSVSQDTNTLHGQSQQTNTNMGALSSSPSATREESEKIQDTLKEVQFYTTAGSFG